MRDELPTRSLRIGSARPVAAYSEVHEKVHGLRGNVALVGEGPDFLAVEVPADGIRVPGEAIDVPAGGKVGGGHGLAGVLRLAVRVLVVEMEPQLLRRVTQHFHNIDFR